MKKIIAGAFIAMAFIYHANAQDATKYSKTDAAKFKAQQFENFLSTLLSINAEAPSGAAYLDLSKDPLIKLNIPLRKIDADKNYFAFFESKFTSTNNYVPLLKKGKWQPDIDLLFSQTWMPLKQRWFYKSDIRALETSMGLAPNTGINSMTINKASFVRFAWINVKTGFNFKKLGFFDDQVNTPYDDRIFEKKISSFIMKISGNLYLLRRPHDKSSRIGFYATAGYELNTKDNNYASLEKTSVKIMHTYSNGNGESYEETKDEADLRKGDFKTGISHSFPFNATLIFNPGNTDFNLNFYGKHKVFDGFNTTDLGISLFLPIPKDDEGKSSINVGLKFDLPDVRNQMTNLPIKEKIKFGIALAVPIIPAAKNK